MTTKHRWVIQEIPLLDGQVAFLGFWWPMSLEDLALLQCGITVNLALAEYVACAREELVKAA